MAAIENAAYRASVDLAREKAAFPLFDRDAYVKAGHASTLSEDIRIGIAKHGRIPLAVRSLCSFTGCRRYCIGSGWCRCYEATLQQSLISFNAPTKTQSAVATTNDCVFWFGYL